MGPSGGRAGSCYIGHGRQSEFDRAKEDADGEMSRWNHANGRPATLRPPRLAFAPATIRPCAGPAITSSPLCAHGDWLLTPTDRVVRRLLLRAHPPERRSPLLPVPFSPFGSHPRARPGGSADCPGRRHSALSHHAALVSPLLTARTIQAEAGPWGWRSANYKTHHRMSQWEIDLRRHTTLCHPSRSIVSLYQSSGVCSCRSSDAEPCL